jgi:hypothetical protein
MVNQSEAVEGQTIQWPKDKTIQWSTDTLQQTKDWATRSPLKHGG